MHNQVTLAGVHLAHNLHEVGTTVVVTVGNEDQGGVALHAGDEGFISLKAIAHAGHTTENLEVAAQLLKASGHGGAIPGALGDNGAVGRKGVQATVVAQSGDSGVNARKHAFGHNDLVLLELVVLHHHGTRVVHDEVEAFNFLVASRSGRSGHGVAQNKSGRKSKKTKRFHTASQTLLVSSITVNNSKSRCARHVTGSLTAIGLGDGNCF